ncbi:MAG: type pilus assembly PilZ [Myxococcales bacterium]|nr:type pilus assembly PilZ [Myxococcales bacterium]
MTFHFGKKKIAGRTHNLSRGGLCADLADAIPMGVTVDVDIVLVFDDDMQSEALRIPGRVVWCTPLDEAHQIGLSFLPLDAERTKYLALFLGYLDNTKKESAPRNQSIDDRFR